MWRKSDNKKEMWQVLFPAPSKWHERHLAISSSVRNDGSSHQRVTLSSRSSDQIAPTVLNPDLVNISSLIDAGVTIDPKSVRGILNITDRADLDRLNTVRSENVYKYLVEHEDEIFSAAGKVKSEK